MPEPIYCDGCGMLLQWRDNGWFCDTHGEWIADEDSIECEWCLRHRAVLDGGTLDADVYRCQICDHAFQVKHKVKELQANE